MIDFLFEFEKFRIFKTVRRKYLSICSWSKYFSFNSFFNHRSCHLIIDCFFVILKIYNSACRTCECFDQTIFYWNNIFFNNRNLPVFRFRGVFSVNSIILLYPIFKKVFYNVVSWSDDWENCVMGCLRGLRYEQSIIYFTSIFSICTLICNW